MKKSSYTIGAFIVLLFAAIVFVAIPAISGITDSSRLPPYAYFNSKPITFSEGSDFLKAAQEEMQLYESRGYDLNNPDYRSFFYSQIFDSAFTKVISKNILNFFTNSTGYIVSEFAIDRKIRNDSAFLDGSGTFSAALYEDLSDTDKRNIRNNLREELTALRSYEDIFGSAEEIGKYPIYGLKTSTAEVDFIRKLSSNLYSFEMVSFDTKQFPDSEKIAFGEAHKDLFVKYNLKVITSSDEQEIKEVASRIKKSEIVFEDAIAEYSKKQLGDENTGDLSANSRYQLENAFTKPEYLEKVISLKPGEISDIVETASTYCIFKSMSEPTQPDFTNSLTLTEVYEYLLTREKSVIEDYYVNHAKDFIAAANQNGFDSACEEYSKSSTTFMPFALNYGNTSLIGESTAAKDEILKYATTNENFFKTAFKLKKNEISSPVVISSANSVIVLKCNDITKKETSEIDTSSIAGTINATSKNSTNESILGSNPRIKRNAEKFLDTYFSLFFPKTTKTEE